MSCDCIEKSIEQFEEIASEEKGICKKNMLSSFIPASIEIKFFVVSGNEENMIDEKSFKSAKMISKKTYAIQSNYCEFCGKKKIGG